MSKLGEVEIEMEDEVLVLKPTPHALRTILTKCGGAQEAFRKIYLMDYQTIFDVLEAATAASYEKKVNAKVLEENIFKHGIINLVAPLTKYVNLLINGGKEPVEEDDNSKKK